MGVVRAKKVNLSWTDEMNNLQTFWGETLAWATSFFNKKF